MADDAEETLRNVLDNILDKEQYRDTSRDVKIKLISSDAEYYTSALFTIEVSFPNKEDLKLFAKVGCIDEEMRERMNADWLYETERYVYTELMDIYESIQDEHEISEENRFTFPKYYGHSAEVGEETMVLENLVESGYTSFNRFNSFDWDTARVGVENLAKFHALSFAFEKKYPEKFNKTVPNMKYRVDSEEHDEETKAVWIKMVQEAVDVLKEEQKQKVLDYLSKGTRLPEYYFPRGNSVICHGDYRVGNLLFKGQGDSRKAMLIDYQTAHCGCPVADLIYFIFMGSDEKFRARYYEQLVARYYSSLQEALARLCVDAVEVYPRDKFDSDMKQLLPYAALLGAIFLPIVTAEARKALKIDSVDVSDFKIKPKQLFAYRFSGIVNDLFAMGVF